MEKTVRMMMDLIASEICGKTLEVPQSISSEKELEDLYELAKFHDLAHLVGNALLKNGWVTEESIKAKFQKQVVLAVYRCERMNDELNRLRKALNEAKIPFVPLKGAVLRQYYPEPWMRTSCDIDLLVRENDLERATDRIVSELAYRQQAKGPHDVGFLSESGVHLELHYSLSEEKSVGSMGEILQSVWKETEPVGNSFEYILSDEMFYYYHIAHMAKHFAVLGGCGIRPFLDLFLLDHVEGTDTAQRDCLLDRGGLSEFANAARRLSRVWFGGEPMDALSEKMQDYILRGGSFGTTDNRVAAKKRSGGRAKYLLSRMFIPYARLKRYYPILERHKWLMPVMQIRRWFMLLNPDVRSMAKYELQANRSVSDEKIQDTQALLRRLGL